MHAVFYCENCRKPVSLEAIECPHCGSRFTAVQCPRCSFVGEARLFYGGCPQCGFLAPTVGGVDDKATAAPRPRRGRAASPASGAASSARRGGQARQTKGISLPGWFYGLASILLALVLIALVVILLHL